jgi:hypothetical protein
MRQQLLHRPQQRSSTSSAAALFLNLNLNPGSPAPKNLRQRNNNRVTEVASWRVVACSRARFFMLTRSARKQQRPPTEDGAEERCIFLTVGTTSFDQLVAAVDSPEFVAAASARGYTGLTIQAWPPLLSACGTHARSPAGARRVSAQPPGA